MSSDAPDITGYAESLAALGDAEGTLPQLEEQIGKVVALIGKNPGVRRFLADPHVKTEGKRKALEQLLEGRIASSLLYFLFILVHTRAILRLPDLADAFSVLVARRRDRASGRLVSAKPIPAERVAEIEEAAGRLLGQPVRLLTSVDPNLIGGLLVQVGDFVLDGTVERQLSQIRSDLMA